MSSTPRRTFDAAFKLQMAITLRQPTAGLLVHSDRGSQYASAAHQQLLADKKWVASMSRKGNCWDNAVMKRVFLNLKTEPVWRQCAQPPRRKRS